MTTTKDDEKRDWIAKGYITHRGVEFYFYDLTRSEVEQRVRDNEFDQFDTKGAETCDLLIYAKTLEPNE